MIFEDYKLENALTMARYVAHHNSIEIEDGVSYYDNGTSEPVKSVHVYDEEGYIVAGAIYDLEEATILADIFSTLT